MHNEYQPQKTIIMTKYIITFILTLLSGALFSQIIWSEDFNSYTDPSGIVGPGTNNIGDYPTSTPWTLDASLASLTATSDYGYVTGGQFTCRDIDGEFVFTTPSINISGCLSTDFSIDFSETGNHEPSDYINVEYSTDGGVTYTLITNWAGLGDATHTLIDDFTSTNLNITGLTGSSLILRISFSNNTGSEYLSMDNIVISCSSSTSITTGTIYTPPFNVDCGNGNNALGSVDFTSSGTFNPGNIYQVEISDATGSFASPTVIGSLASTSNSGNIPFSIPADFPSGTGYLIRIVATNPSTIGTTSTPFSITQTNPCDITAGTIYTPPFSVNCSTNTPATGSIDYTVNGSLNAGNDIIVELSDPFGGFLAPYTIATVNSTSTSGTINFTIPANVSSGTNYLIRIRTTSPVMSDTNTSPFSITQMQACNPVLPGNNGLIINEFSNGPSGLKEYYEFVVAGKCGDTVDIRGYILDDNNATFTTPSFYDGTPSGIAQGHFRFSNHAQWSNIPVGSLIVVYNANDPNPNLPPDDPFDSNNDSLYVVPHNNAALFESCTTLPAPTAPDSVYSPCTYITGGLWSPLGIRNSGDAIQVRLPNGAYYHGISYGGPEISGGPHNLKLFTGSGSGKVGYFNSGDFFDISNWSEGNVPADETPGIPNNALNFQWIRDMRELGNPDCPVDILPVELSYFTGQKTTNGNQLNWKTVSEENASHFFIERSIDGINWRLIKKENAVGNSTTQQLYEVLDTQPDKQVNYYRLTQVDFDGEKTIYSKYVVIDNTNDKIYRVKIINIMGQEIEETQKGLQIHVFSNGTTLKVYKQ